MDPEDLELEAQLEHAVAAWMAGRCVEALDGRGDEEAEALLEAERRWVRWLRPTWSADAIDRAIADDGAP